MAAPATEHVRNIVLVGQDGAGKTSLAEAMLHVSGRTPRMGTTHDGKSYLCLLYTSDGFIAEDVPYVDLTCAVLGIGDEPGEMDYFTREDCVLAGTEVVRRIMGKLGCEVESAEPSGTRVAAGGTFMTVRGTSAGLHAAWKVCLNVFDHCSACLLYTSP